MLSQGEAAVHCSGELVRESVARRGAARAGAGAQGQKRKPTVEVQRAI